MFEFSIIKKYLVPRRKQLSVSLIALMSILVISLVVWLLLLFFSITEGIEKNWLGRLTALNAPIRIVPTDAYYRSYYYKIDTISQNSNYSPKTIHEKRLALSSDPYDPTLDETIPSYWPLPVIDQSQVMVDPVKRAFGVFEELSLSASDYEISGAMLKLNLIRPSVLGDEEQSFLTQVSYVSTFPSEEKQVQKLFSPPSTDDVNHLLFIHKEEFFPILSNVNLKSIRTSPLWTLPINLIPDGATFQGALLPSGILLGSGGPHKFTKKDLEEKRLPIRVQTPLMWKASIDPSSLAKAKELRNVMLIASTELQGVHLQGMIPWEEIEIVSSDVYFLFAKEPVISPPWMHMVDGRTCLPHSHGVIVPKNFRDNGVKIGDEGALSYGSFATTALQEQTISVEVAGFYDPGLMIVGARPIFTEDDIVQTIRAASPSVAIDPLLSNGIQIWFDDLSQTKEIASLIKARFEEKEISPYWQINTFYDYDFAKDLLKQFRSDRYLFTLIGLIILIVACTNIISLLLLLVHSKKKEIGILQVLGAKKRHIALIFGLAGAFLGTISGVIGTVLGLITLQHLDALIQLLSFLQGQDAFNTAFYGSSLPNSVSPRAILFILLTTPVISLLAGLIPAIKACQFSPIETLRSE